LDLTWDKAAGGWTNLHNEELHNLYPSPNIIRVIKSRRMRWAGHVARIGEMHTKFWFGSLKGRDNSKDLGVDGRVILKWIFGI
jgi:hypothetical protein